MYRILNWVISRVYTNKPSANKVLTLRLETLCDNAEIMSTKIAKLDGCISDLNGAIANLGLAMINQANTLKQINNSVETKLQPGTAVDALISEIRHRISFNEDMITMLLTGKMSDTVEQVTLSVADMIASRKRALISRAKENGSKSVNLP